MSQILTDILDHVRGEYIRQMQTSGELPFVTAEQLCHDKLFLAGDLLARIIIEDPTLLAARAGEMISDPKEQDNPAVGVIISTNILVATMEALMATAVEHGWLEVDEEGHVLVDEAEAKLDRDYKINADYSHSETAQQNLTKPGRSLLNQMILRAEEEYLQRLGNEVQDAYQLALEVSSENTVFAPEDIAPLVAENPLLLGLRPDNMVDDDVFDGDPPAGIIISGHITQMILDHLLELAAEQGALAIDSEGLMILPEEDTEVPVIH